MHRTKVRIVEDALDANNTIARANRDDFDRHAVSVLNLMSAPGAGKTSLLERALGAPLQGDDGTVRVGVLEGDVQGSIDADRLATIHVPVVQLNTGNGFGGECHLDANMVRSALPALPLDEIRPRQAAVQHRRGQPGSGDRADQRAHGGGRRRAARLAGAAVDARGRGRMR
jgi:hydrogenase nickel incorporation protein HypB